MARGGVSVTSPAPRAAWLQTLEGDSDALVTQSPAWIDALCAVGGHADASRLYTLADGRHLVLPLVRRRRVPRVLAPRSSLPPAWGMGGILATGGVSPEDVAVVFADLATRPGVRTSVRPNPLHADAWAAASGPGTAVVPRLAHVLELGCDFEVAWNKRFTGPARTAVRKAERSGLTVECDTTGRLVPDFYELFERSLERWGTQHREPAAFARWRGHRRDPKRKFEVMARTLGGCCRIWLASKEGRPVAAILVLQDANAHYTRGVMEKDLAGPTRANYLLHRLAIEDACKAGCRYYHMGESGSSASLAQFKTRFGARAHPYAEYHLESLPLTAIDRAARTVVKSAIGFRD
ncbi:MAG: GNAT family N-acetyltransferase [Actinomycetota bacterium]|nr:GNAT family N-acetyltransferase [Actinomycetota bacterium]